MQSNTKIVKKYITLKSIRRIRRLCRLADKLKKYISIKAKISVTLPSKQNHPTDSRILLRSIFELALVTVSRFTTSEKIARFIGKEQPTASANIKPMPSIILSFVSEYRNCTRILYNIRRHTSPKNVTFSDSSNLNKITNLKLFTYIRLPVPSLKSSS